MSPSRGSDNRVTCEARGIRGRFRLAWRSSSSACLRKVISSIMPSKYPISPSALRMAWAETLAQMGVPSFRLSRSSIPATWPSALKRSENAFRPSASWYRSATRHCMNSSIDP